MKNKLKAIGAALALATLAILASVSPPQKRAEAAQPYAADKVAVFSGATQGIGVVMTAVSGTQLVVKGMLVTSNTATTLQFYDGSGTDTPLYKLYLAANTPQQITESVLGAGFKTSSGNALYAVAGAGESATVTVHIAFRYNIE